MSYNNSTDTPLRALLLLTALNIATSDCNASLRSGESPFAQQTKEYYNENASGEPIMYYGYSSEDYSRSCSTLRSIGISSVKMKLRYEALNKSFQKYKNEFPSEKENYFNTFANAVCQLQFNDNVSIYNKYDETIDSVLKLQNGLTLSISQFINEDIDAPVVFSIHREKTLLISDELPLEEIVNTINSIS